jgi:streptomycin 6-kinase
MSQPLEQAMPVPATAVWCGRSWEALLDRRCDAFAHAVALLEATEQDSRRVVSEFLEFFDGTGVALFRDEEEWIFRSLRPTPPSVIRALQEHFEISRLVTSLIHETQAGCMDLRVVHALGALLEEHLLSEEEEVRPLSQDLLRAVPGPLAPEHT